MHLNKSHKQQIKFRDKKGKSKHGHHARSVSDYGVVSTFNSVVLKQRNSISINDEEVIIPKMQQLLSSKSQPETSINSNQNVGHQKNNSIKSASASSTSHHSSISSNASEHKENTLGSSATITPTASFIIDHDMELMPGSDSSILDESEIQKENELQPMKRHRRTSSGQGKTYGVTKTGHLDIPL